MRRGMLSALALMCVALVPLAAQEERPLNVPPEGFRALFNGRDLTGWRLKTAEELYGTDTEPDGRPIAYSPDSGIYLRGTSKAQTNIWVNPLGSGEVWGYRTDRNMPEEVREAVTPRVHADRPVGEWNHQKTIMRGDRLTVVLNGETVIENAQLPGIPERGPIALQHHGRFNQETGRWEGGPSSVQFRNIFIRCHDSEAEDG